MKGLARAALEKVWRIEMENRDLRASEALVGLGLQPKVVGILLSVLDGKPGPEYDVKRVLDEFAFEFERVKDENRTLIEHMRLLGVSGGGGVMSAVCSETDPFHDIRADYQRAIAEAKEYKPLIAQLRAQISAMEFDWTQAKNMRDELFDYEDKLREQQMVAEMLHLKCVPLPGVQVFATSKRHMIEVLVEDRNRNINGFFARHVVPLERLRIEKDAEILELRKTIRKLELRACASSVQLKKEELDVMDLRVIQLESKHSGVLKRIEEGEAQLKGLNSIIKKFEDRVGDWKMAYEQAVSMIGKAEHVRAEYDGMMTTLREEDARVVAKKKEFERLQAKCSGAAGVDAYFKRLKAISEEIDEVEGEIAAKGLELQRLKAALAAKVKMLESEQNALGLVKQKIQLVQAERLKLEEPVGEEEELDADMMDDFSHVCV
jgi:hypothetical protein